MSLRNIVGVWGFTASSGEEAQDGKGTYLFTIHFCHTSFLTSFTTSMAIRGLKNQGSLKMDLR